MVLYGHPVGGIKDARLLHAAQLPGQGAAEAVGDHHRIQEVPLGPQVVEVLRFDRMQGHDHLPPEDPLPP